MDKCGIINAYEEGVKRSQQKFVVNGAGCSESGRV